ncbi:MAG: hypothetical protein SPF22_07445 [Candidatus Onthovivens sp.]|nr:hypothetical protein [Candidatus Onthovivens sp.]
MKEEVIIRNMKSDYFNNRLKVGMSISTGIPISFTNGDCKVSDKEKSEFMTLLRILSDQYFIYKNDEEFIDGLKEIYGEDCVESFDKVLIPEDLLPRQ